ncbi:MAG: hypothetical protein ABI880_11740 [Acidobacteriota bacterium]
MPYLRLTADRRGYENTFLLHASVPGERAKVIYWYRTAPGLRVGRPALDDGAMRTLEEQYPDIDFDWPYLLDVASMTPVEVEAPVPVRKRKPPVPSARRSDDEETSDATAEAAPAPRATPVAEVASDAPLADAAPAADFDLLSELLGRGIATSLRANYQDVAAQLEASAAEAAVKAGWRERLAVIDPDGWTAPDDVLAGMATVEHDTEDLRRAIEAAEGR